MISVTLAVGAGCAGYPERLAERLGSDAPARLWLRGDPELLREPPLALLCSVRLPAELVLPTLELARGLRDRAVPTVSGFQSPLERRCLELLLGGRQAVVACPARAVLGMRMPPPWRPALEQGRLLVLGALAARVRRPTARVAERRNRVVAALADEVFIAHASPGGRLHELAREVVARGQPLACFDHPRNHDLLLLGARPVDPGAEAARDRG